MTTQTALIIGGGFIGACCALRLCELGCDVTLLDPRIQNAPASFDPASFGNAGHIAVEQCEPLASPAQIMNAPRRFFAFGGALDMPISAARHWAPFATRYLAASAPSTFKRGKETLTALLQRAMPAWRNIAETCGAKDLFREDGHFVVWEGAKSAEKGRASWATQTAPSAAFQTAEEPDLRTLRKLTTASVHDAIRFTKSGQVRDLHAMHQAIIAHAQSLGMNLVNTAAERLDVKGERAHVICNDGHIRSADTVVIAAGIGSRALMQSIGHKTPLIAERGYHIEGPVSDWPDDLPPVVFEDRALIITRFRNTLRLASFVEFAGVETPPDIRKWRRLYEHANALGIRFSGPVTEWMGARPTLPDYLPAIGRSRRADNLLYAFGHNHLGLTLAPITAELIAEHVATGAAPLTALDIERFS